VIHWCISRRLLVYEWANGRQPVGYETRRESNLTYLHLTLDDAHSKGHRKVTKAVRIHDSNLVDPASSHMLVSKIKPCMSKYKQFIL
jgi:hypothetical protein